MFGIRIRCCNECTLCNVQQGENWIYGFFANHLVHCVQWMHTHRIAIQYNTNSMEFSFQKVEITYAALLIHQMLLVIIITQYKRISAAYHFSNSSSHSFRAVVWYDSYLLYISIHILCTPYRRTRINIGFIRSLYDVEQSEFDCITFWHLHRKFWYEKVLMDSFMKIWWGQWKWWISFSTCTECGHTICIRMSCFFLVFWKQSEKSNAKGKHTTTIRNGNRFISNVKTLFFSHLLSQYPLEKKKK